MSPTHLFPSLQDDLHYKGLLDDSDVSTVTDFLYKHNHPTTNITLCFFALVQNKYLTVYHNIFEYIVLSHFIHLAKYQWKSVLEMLIHNYHAFPKLLMVHVNNPLFFYSFLGVRF